MVEPDKTSDFPRPIGLMAVLKDLALKVPPPALRSSVIAGARKTRIENGIVYEHYPKTYAANSLKENLKFAMRYEPIDLSILSVAFEKIEPGELEKWVRHEPTGIYARKIW